MKIQIQDAIKSENLNVINDIITQCVGAKNREVLADRIFDINRCHAYDDDKIAYGFDKDNFWVIQYYNKSSLTPYGRICDSQRVLLVDFNNQ